MQMKEILDKAHMVWEKGIKEMNCEETVCVECKLCKFCEVMGDLILWTYKNEELLKEIENAK